MGKGASGFDLGPIDIHAAPCSPSSAQVLLCGRPRWLFCAAPPVYCLIAMSSQGASTHNECVCRRQCRTQCDNGTHNLAFPMRCGRKSVPVAAGLVLLLLLGVLWVGQVGQDARGEAGRLPVEQGSVHAFLNPRQEMLRPRPLEPKMPLDGARPGAAVDLPQRLALIPAHDTAAQIHQYVALGPGSSRRQALRGGWETPLGITVACRCGGAFMCLPAVGSGRPGLSPTPPRTSTAPRAAADATRPMASRSLEYLTAVLACVHQFSA